jgi:hypothetical protein
MKRKIILFILSKKNPVFSANGKTFGTLSAFSHSRRSGRTHELST